MQKSKKPPCVLLVEDNPGDIRLTQEAFSETGHAVQLEVVTNGVDALDYLNSEGKFTGKPRPDIIILDINLPKWDGKEVLKRIKSDESLRLIPVLVLTTSNATSDIQSVYELQANCFITKPVDFVRFFEVVELIQRFWLDVVTLPSVA